MKKELIDYNDGSAELEAFVAYEEADSLKPLVLVVHDWSAVSYTHLTLPTN